MGEIADMMINGDLDFYTGEYMGSRGYGIPRTLDKSLSWERGYNKKSGAYGGVVNFCMQKNKTQSQANKIIKRYGREVLKIQIPKIEPNEFMKILMPVLLEICGKIQADFNPFKIWFKENT